MDIKKGPGIFLETFDSERHPVCQPMFEFWERVQCKDKNPDIQNSLLEIDRLVRRFAIMKKNNEKPILYQTRELEARIVDLTRQIEGFKERNLEDKRWLDSIEEYANGMLLEYIEAGLEVK